MPPRSERSSSTDRGWAWIVLLSSSAINFFMFGSYSSFSVYFAEMIGEFGHGRGVTAWVGAIASGMAFLVGPLGSYLTERYDCRRVVIAGSLISAAGYAVSFFAHSIFLMFVSYGFMVGCGFGISHIAGVVAVSNYFCKHRTLATALFMAGGGVGQLGLPPISQLLIDAYGWRGTMWIFCGFALQLIIFGALLRPFDERKSSTSGGVSAPHSPDLDRELYSEKEASQTSPESCKRGWSGIQEDAVSEASVMLDLTRRSHLDLRETFDPGGRGGGGGVTRTYTYTDIVLVIASSCMWSVNMFSVIVLVSAYSTSIGVNKTDASFAVTILGTFNAVGRLVAGATGSTSSECRTRLFVISTVLHGISTVFLALCKDFLTISLCTGGVGLFYGIKFGLVATVLTALFGLPSLPKMYGACMFAIGLGGLTGPPLAGFLADITHDFTAAFWFSGATGAISMALFVVLLHRVNVRHLKARAVERHKKLTNNFAG